MTRNLYKNIATSDYRKTSMTQRTSVIRNIVTGREWLG